MVGLALVGMGPAQVPEREVRHSNWRAWIREHLANRFMVNRHAGAVR